MESCCFQKGLLATCRKETFAGAEITGEQRKVKKGKEGKLHIQVEKSRELVLVRSHR